MQEKNLQAYQVFMRRRTQFKESWTLPINRKLSALWTKLGNLFQTHVKYMELRLSKRQSKHLQSLYS